MLELVVETEEPAWANTAGDGVRHGACGIVGGRDGAPHHYVLRSGRHSRELKTKEVGIPVEPGDMFVIHSGGGGGWGSPRQRRSEARAADRENGFVTRKPGIRRKK